MNKKIKNIKIKKIYKKMEELPKKPSVLKRCCRIKCTCVLCLKEEKVLSVVKIRSKL
jgi:hypothetical protein